MGRRRGKGAERRFSQSGKQSGADFAPTRPPAAQEKAIAEAKALAEQQ